MKDCSSKVGRPQKQQNPRLGTVKRLLSMAQLIRQHGNPDEAAEALEWEKRLAERLGEVKEQEKPLAA